MQKIVLLGAGNVATHLYKAFAQAEDLQVVQVYNRSADNLEFFKDKVAVTTSLEELKPADVYVVSVSDDAVTELVSQIKDPNTLIVHTSGSVPLLKLAQRNGVFYPLQTFSKHTEVDFKEIPLCIEAESSEDLEILKKLAACISDRVYEISSDQRKSLHLAAVFACNFTNHLYRIAEKICEENQVPFEVLHPLITETARKINFDSPAHVQTGPAKRGDQKTIDYHLSQLNSPDLKEIYTLLTRLIQQEHE